MRCYNRDEADQKIAIAAKTIQSVIETFFFIRPSYAPMLTGGDIFSLTVSRDISNIDEFLIYCYRKYKEDTYKTRFAWIDNI